MYKGSFSTAKLRSKLWFKGITYLDCVSEDIHINEVHITFLDIYLAPIGGGRGIVMPMSVVTSPP